MSRIAILLVPGKVMMKWIDLGEQGTLFWDKPMFHPWHAFGACGKRNGSEKSTGQPRKWWQNLAIYGNLWQSKNIAFFSWKNMEKVWFIDGLPTFETTSGSSFWNCRRRCDAARHWAGAPAGWMSCERWPATFGYGSIPTDTLLVGWTSIYQLFWGSLGTRVLTSHICGKFDFLQADTRNDSPTRAMKHTLLGLWISMFWFLTPSEMPFLVSVSVLSLFGCFLP